MGYCLYGAAPGHCSHREMPGHLEEVTAKVRRGEVPEAANRLWQHQSTALLCWPGRGRSEQYCFGLAKAPVAAFRISVPQAILWSKS